jgi:uncharacterized protein YaaN involved in tellurite resistance
MYLGSRNLLTLIKTYYFASIPYLSYTDPHGCLTIFQHFEKLSVQFEKISDQLDNARMQMLRDITLLDNMFTRNQEYRKTLERYIAAGQLKLQELQTTILPELKAKAEESKDSMDAQKYNDFSQEFRFTERRNDRNC